MDISTLGDYVTHLSVCAICGKAPAEKPQNLSFEEIYDFAKRHMIECSAYYSVEKLQEKCGFFDKWTKHVSQMSAADAIQRIEFERLCDFFESENVSFIPLKGFVIKDCYPLGDMRRMSDLDIFVTDENAAHEAMLKLGYECKSFGECHHNTYYLKPVMNVEIHKTLSEDDRIGQYFDDICKNAIKNSAKCHTELDIADMMSYIVYHTYKHFCGGGCGIRVVLDLYLLSQKYAKELASAEFSASLEKLKLKKFYSSIIQLAKVWFEDASPCKTDMILAKYFYKSGAYGTITHRNENVVASNLEDEKNVASAKRKSIIKIMFPDTKHMKKHFPYLNKCILLLPIAYVHRAFRGIFVRKKLSKITMAASVSEKNVSESHELFKMLGIE